VEATRKALEHLQAEHHAGVQSIAAWAGEASTTLVSLRVSPIPVSELPASITDALPVLDSTADRLRRLDQILGARLEAEDSKLCRAVVEYVLTCFRSHDPAITLAPVIDGPVAATEDAPRRAYKMSWRRWPLAFSVIPPTPNSRSCRNKARVPLGAAVITFGFLTYSKNR
jgi:hypothetical protein